MKLIFCTAIKMNYPRSSLGVLIKFTFPIHSCAHSRHVEAHLTISFIETQRDIIANNQQYNNRFNYAVSFQFIVFSNIVTFFVSEQFHQDVKVHPAYIPPPQPF